MWRVLPFTRRVVNPVTRLFAGWMPGFGMLTYLGRTTPRLNFALLDPAPPIQKLDSDRLALVAQLSLAFTGAAP
jgi:hypothetical protein